MHKTFAAAALAAATFAFAAEAQAPVDVVALYKEFQSNEPGFTQRYKGRTMSVSGTVFNIVAAGDSSFVGVGDKPDGIVGQLLLCHTTPATLANLAKGQKRVFTGVITGANSSGIHMQPCTF